MYMECDFILGSKDGAEVSLLALHQYDPGSTLAHIHMWVKFVVGLRLTPRVSLWVLQFSFLHRNQHLQIPIHPG